jgi:hypothetical protein
MIHPHMDAKIYKKNDMGKKTGGKLSAEHGKHGIDEKTSVSFVHSVVMKISLRLSGFVFERK